MIAALFDLQAYIARVLHKARVAQASGAAACFSLSIASGSLFFGTKSGSA